MPNTLKSPKYSEMSVYIRWLLSYSSGRSRCTNKISGRQYFELVGIIGTAKTIDNPCNVDFYSLLTSELDRSPTLYWLPHWELIEIWTTENSSTRTKRPWNVYVGICCILTTDKKYDMILTTDSDLRYTANNLVARCSRPKLVMNHRYIWWL